MQASDHSLKKRRLDSLALDGPGDGGAGNYVFEVGAKMAELARRLSQLSGPAAQHGEIGIQQREALAHQEGPPDNGLVHDLEHFRQPRFRRTLARVALAPALQSQPTTVLQSVFKNCNRERGTGSISTIEHDLEMDTPPQAQEKERKCLHCRDEFTSRWYGERVCRRCKSNSFWRGSVEAFLEL